MSKQKNVLQKAWVCWRDIGIDYEDFPESELGQFKQWN